ncbi:hypothetical protein AX774_g7247 [Zancudomyces culisetae]|uniref:Uncharacterized protein n=1 Tax=Zancudomyces culisetae TaxID=1213189 RepID=A0A1R1PEE4_ZANCU|nr:hypothetical protein AX774_g7247 [Zancudomyces culisetae]|eukprot:OMH79344.1 hypothetical protein AX774_g7247 [Zancudomyces culisetae]
MNILICRLRCGSQIRVQHIATSNAYYKSTNIYTQRVKSYTNGLRKHAFSVWLKAFDDIKRLGSDRNYVSNGIQGYLAYKRSQYNNQDLCGRASYHNNVLVNEKSSRIYGSYEPLGVTYRENARKKSSESKIANNVLMVDDHADLHAHCVLNTNGNTNSCDLQKTTHSLVEEPALLNLVSETNKTGGCSTQGVEVSPPAPRIFSEMPQHFRVHSDSLSEETLRINNKLLPTKNSSHSLMRPELSKRIFFSDTALYDFGVSDIWNNLRYNRQLQAGDSSKSMFRYTSKQPVSDMTSGAQDKRGSGSNFAENLSGDLIRRLDEFAESIATRLKVNAFKKLVILDRAIKTADSHYFRKKTERAIKKLRLYSENVCINRIMDKTPKKLLSEVSVITNNGQKNHLDCDIKEKNENTHGQTSVYADRNTILDKLFENSTCGFSSKQFTEDNTESSLLETPNDEYTEQIFAIAMGLRTQLSSSLVYHYLSCLYQLYVECSNGLIQFGHVDKRNMLTNKSDRVNRTLLRCWRIWNRQHLKVTLGNTSGIVNGSIDKRSGHIESFTSNIEVYSGGEPLETKYPCAPCQNSTPINERSTYLESYTGSHGNSSFISNSSECLDPQRPSDFHLNWERAVNMYNTFLIVDVIVKLQDLKCMFDTHNRYD